MTKISRKEAALIHDLGTLAVILRDMMHDAGCVMSGDPEKLHTLAGLLDARKRITTEERRAALSAFLKELLTKEFVAESLKGIK